MAGEIALGIIVLVVMFMVLAAFVAWLSGFYRH